MPITCRAPQPPAEAAEHELARLRECRRLLQERLDQTGHIGCAEVTAILAATAPPSKGTGP